LSIKKFKFYQYSISIKEDENFSSLDDIEDEDTEPTIPFYTLKPFKIVTDQCSA
jgi:hypothetical protein